MRTQQKRTKYSDDLFRGSVLLALLSVGLLVSGTSAKAGEATYDFTTDPASVLTIVGNNDTPWQAAGGNPGGFLAITYPVGSQYTGVVFPDIDAGKIVDSFTFECDMRIGNSTGDRPADGFAISFARGNDPLLESLPDSTASTGNFAGGIPEGGSRTGIAISFDTWSGNTFPDDPADTTDIEGIIIRVDNVTVRKQALPTRHGACDDITSLQTGPRNADYWTNGGDPVDPQSWADLCWQPFFCSVDKTGKVTVKFKGNTILDQFQTTYFPSVGRLILSGRTGGANENTHFDNVKLTTTSIVDTTPPVAPANWNLQVTALHPRRVKLTWTAATDDSGRAAYEIERDGTVLPGLISATSYSENVAPNTTYSYKVRALDPALNKSDFSAATSFKTPVEVLTFTPGMMKYEAFTGFGGVTVDDLINNDKYINNTPDFVRAVPGYEGVTGFGDNYGARVSGFITPTETANYVLFMSADDGAQLFLSTDDNPANKKLIAIEPTWNGVRQWTVTTRRDPDNPENRSDKYTGTEWPGGATINLVAGRRYYTELLYKEGGGGDNGAVAMIKAGSPAPGNGSPALGGNLIGATVDPAQGKPLLETLKGATVASGGTATFSASAVGTAPITYQWRFRPLLSAATADVPGATAATLEVKNVSAANTGIYSVVAKNDEGEVTSNLAMLAIDGTLFIEAEDFNFDRGQYDKTNPIGMTGPYPGGTYLNKGNGADGAPGAGIDLGVDYSEAVVSNDAGAVPAYRVGTGVEIAKPNAHADGIPRGSFDISVNYVAGWNDPGDWYNYTRPFPEPAKDYNVIGRLSSGGNPIIAQLDEVTGATTASQTLKKLGDFKPGRATAGWDNMEFFQLTDDAGNAAVVNAGGEKTIRFSVLPGANLDVDYFMFVPAGAAGPKDVTKPGDTIVSSHDAARSPAGEQVVLVIDDKATTKYLNFGDGTDNNAPLTGITGFTVTPSAGSTIVTGLGLTSANDSPERDPATYKLEGSNDGTTFTAISEGAVPAFGATRALRVETSFANSAAYKIYRLTFPTVVNNTTANSMQIAEVEFLGTAAPSGPSLSITASGGQVSITFTGALQASDSVAGPYTDVAGATSPYSAPASGVARFFRSRQ